MSTATIYAHRFDARERRGDRADRRQRAGRTDQLEAQHRDRASLGGRAARGEHAAHAQGTAPHGDGDDPRHAGESSTCCSVLSSPGLGGSIAGGRQYISWIHERDFVRAVEFLMERDELVGAVNLAAPHPLPQRDFMAELRARRGRAHRAAGDEAGWSSSGAFFLRTETELVLKSRYVVPGRLLNAGFSFDFPEWPQAARDSRETSRSLTVRLSLPGLSRRPEAEPRVRVDGRGGRQLSCAG